MSIKSVKETVDLLSKWIPGFSEEEKRTILQQIKKENNSFLQCSIIEAIKAGDATRQLKILGDLIGVFNTKKSFDIARKIAEKGKGLEFHCTDIVDMHFLYMQVIKMYYQMRDDKPDALGLAIDYCKNQIEIAPRVAIAMKAEFNRGLPMHTGYKQLSIIYEKQGNYDLALEICEEAFMAGWGDGVTTPKSADDWDKRIQRLQKKRDKLLASEKKKMQEKGNDSVKLNLDIMKVPCPHCGSVLLIPKKYIGVRGTCKKCSKKFTVPNERS